MSQSQKTPTSDEQILFRRVAWLAQLAWVGLVFLALWFNHHQFNDEVLALAQQSAQISFNQIKNISRWNVNSDGIYTPTTSSGDDHLVTEDGIHLERMVTSQILSHIQNSSITTGVRSRIISLDPLNPDNKPDGWEKIQLEASVNSLDTISGQTRIEGQPYYRVIHPLQSGPQCLSCHHKSPLNSNLTMGAFSVLVPLQPIKAMLRKKDIGVSSTLLILWLIGCVGIATTTKAILNRIKLRDRAREDLDRSNNLYSALVATNRAIVQQLPRQKLFEKVCEVAVRYGEFKLAWVGMVNENNKQVECVARAGVMGQYVADITVSVDPESEHGCGPTCIAINEKRPVIVKNFLEELAGTTWYEPARRAGIRSSAAFPITFNGTVIGAFKLYADQTDFFSERLIELLQQMAGDISYALETMDKQQKFLEAQKLNQTLIDALPYPALLARFSDQRVVIANRKALEMGIVVGEINSCCQLPDTRISNDIQTRERQRQDGQWDMICWCPVDDSQQSDLYLYFAVDITNQKKQEEAIYDIANRDSLTGLANRRYFNAQLEAMLSTEDSQHGIPFTLILMDLNGFKLVNDTYGHPVGDQLLIKIGYRLQAVLRDGDTLCRWGGDEFVIMLPNSDSSQAQDLAERLNNIFNEPFKLGEIKITSSCSMGLASYPDDGTTVDQLFKAVDREMYAAKRKYYANNTTVKR